MGGRKGGGEGREGGGRWEERVGRRGNALVPRFRWLVSPRFPVHDTKDTVCRHESHARDRTPPPLSWDHLSPPSPWVPLSPSPEIPLSSLLRIPPFPTFPRDSPYPPFPRDPPPPSGGIPPVPPPEGSHPLPLPKDPPSLHSEGSHFPPSLPKGSTPLPPPQGSPCPLPRDPRDGGRIQQQTPRHAEFVRGLAGFICRPVSIRVELREPRNLTSPREGWICRRGRSQEGLEVCSGKPSGVALISISALSRVGAILQR